MNDNIKVRRLVFDNKNPKQVLTPTDRKTVPMGVKNFVIEIAEVEADNPSDLIIVVTAQAQGGHCETPIYLYQYRDTMLYQNSKYIVRLNLELLNVAFTHYDIEVVYENKGSFILTAYLTPIEN